MHKKKRMFLLVSSFNKSKELPYYWNREKEKFKTECVSPPIFLSQKQITVSLVQTTPPGTYMLSDNFIRPYILNLFNVPETTLFC